MIERYKKLLAILAGTSLLTVFVVMLFSSISRYFLIPQFYGVKSCVNTP